MEAIQLMETQVSHRVRELQSDGVREYSNAHTQKFLREKSISHDTSMPYTPEENERAERLTCTLPERVLAMLKDAGLKHECWV